MLLRDIASLTAGVITKRVIENETADGETGKEVLILTPKAIHDGRIEHEHLQKERLKSDIDTSKYFTHCGDIIIKLSAPYDGVIIKNKDDEGLFLPSFLLKIEVTKSEVKKGYLLAYINSPLFKESLMKSCYGSVTALTKKSDLENIDIPILTEEKQEEISVRYERTLAIKDKIDCYLRLEEERLVSMWRETNG